MNESALMIVLRLVHIISGVFWVGAVLLVAWFILPSQSVLGQAAGVFMQELMMRRRLRLYLMVTMILTILSGLVMYARLSMLTQGAWAASTTGRVLGVGALAAIIAGAIGGISGARTARKMGELGAAIQAAGGQPTETQRSEMAAIMSGAQSKLRIVGVLLLITVAAMASARYL